MFYVVIVLAHLVAALGYLAVGWGEVEAAISIALLALVIIALARHWGKGPENAGER